MADNGVVAAGGRLTDWVSLGVLAAFVPRDAVDDAVAAAGKQARRSDGKLPPHVMVYLVMALALFADDDYEEVAARLTETLTAWGCWDDSWSVPTSGGITQARQRLGYQPVQALFGEVAVPVAEELTAGAFLGPWRLMAIDGFEWDAPDTPENAAAFGFAGTGPDKQVRPAYPKVRVVTVSECASHAVVAAAMGAVAGKGAGEQSLARSLYARLEDDWLLIADRNFFSWADWCAAADSGAALLWRVKADLTLPVLELLPDGSYRSVLVNPKTGGKARQQLIEAARAGKDLDHDKARYVRVIEYAVPDRDGDEKGEVIALVTTITEMAAAPAPPLAQAYHQRWEHGGLPARQGLLRAGPVPGPPPHRDRPAHRAGHGRLGHLRHHRRPAAPPHRHPGAGTRPARPGPARRPGHDPAHRPRNRAAARPPAPARHRRALAGLATPVPGPLSLVPPANPARPRNRNPLVS
jgi:Insertion element 4 transposase N-terminal